MPLATIQTAIEQYRAGKFVIIVDDENRENEGDLTMAAEFVTPEAINFMARFARGLICCSLDGRILDHFNLPLMVPPAQNRSGFGTPFTISVEAAKGVTTGISAADRARTVQVLIDPDSQPDDIVTPGHMFPLRARDNGVLERDGQTEACVDLAKIAGLRPGAVLCEIMNDDGTMARMPQLENFAALHSIPIISVAALIEFRRNHLVQQAAE